MKTRCLTLLIPMLVYMTRPGLSGLLEWFSCQENLGLTVQYSRCMFFFLPVSVVILRLYP